MEIIGLTNFPPAKFGFDQRFLPPVSGREFEMATMRKRSGRGERRGVIRMGRGEVKGGAWSHMEKRTELSQGRKEEILNGGQFRILVMLI